MASFGYRQLGSHLPFLVPSILLAVLSDGYNFPEITKTVIQAISFLSNLLKSMSLLSPTRPPPKLFMYFELFLLSYFDSNVNSRVCIYSKIYDRSFQEN